MSRHQPIYISSSEEEPFEDDLIGAQPDEDEEIEEDPEEEPFGADIVPEPVQLPAAPEVQSEEDSSIDTPSPPPPPPVVPAVRPPRTAVDHTWQLFSQLPPRPPLRRTPRMCVRDFPAGCSANPGKAPMHEREPAREEPPPKRLRPAHLDWMPPYLRHWRELEGIPSTYETGESSSSAPTPVPMTGEPVELTVTTLVAVARTLFGSHYSVQGQVRELLRDSRELQSDVSSLEGDVISIYGRLDTVEAQVGEDLEASELMRARIEALEHRATRSDIISGVCIVVTVLMTAVGLLFPLW